MGYLRVIREEIKRNLDVLCKHHAYLYVGLPPTFTLSSFVNEELFSRLTLVCLNHELLNAIFNRYFEFKHIRNRVNQIIKLHNQLDEVRSQDPVNQTRKHSIEKALNKEKDGTLEVVGENIRACLKVYNEISVEINKRDIKVKLRELPSGYLRGKFDEYQHDQYIIGQEAEIIKLFPHFALEKRPRFYST